MKQNKHLTKFFLKLSLLFLIVFLVSFKANSLNETLLEKNPPSEIFSEKATNVLITDELLILKEKKLIDTPKKPYSLDFVTESYFPNVKVDERISVKLNDVLEGKENSFSAYSETNYTFLFIMILGQLTPEKVNNLSKYNVTLLGYHPHQSYKAKVYATNIEKISTLPFVKWAGYSTKNQKLSPYLLNRQNWEGPVHINLFQGEEFEEEFEKVNLSGKIVNRNTGSGKFKKILEDRGVKIISYNEGLKSYFAMVNSSVINHIAELDFVLYIEEEKIGSIAHDQSMSSIGADYLRTTSYDGSGGIYVGVIDSGYENDHLDLPDANYTIDYIGTGVYNDSVGHGTHVSCTIFGRGIGNTKYAGVAKGVDSIQIAKVVNASGNFKGGNLTLAMSWMAQNPKADIVSISLGNESLLCTGTDELSRAADDKVQGDGQIYVVAAGNGGNIANSIWTPGCSKNVITVGSVDDFGNGTIDNISNFSSRGPTGDERKKPDIVAPGNLITSCNSSTDGYSSFRGTSMATPHVSGVISTLVEHFPSLRGNPAKVKALITATALVPKGNISNVGNISGHGKINSYIAHFDRNNSNGWYTGGFNCSVNVTNCCYKDIDLPSGTDRLVVTLAWTEASASSGALTSVINDVDLYIDKEGDESLCSGGEWFSISSDDNLEYYYLDNPVSGTYRIKVDPFYVNLSALPVYVVYAVIRGNTTPVTRITLLANTTNAYLGDHVAVTLTAEPASYIGSGYYSKLSPPGGMPVIDLQATREDGTTMSFGSIISMNLGDIHEGDNRTAVWILNTTTTGIKTITSYVKPDNGRSNQTSINVTVSLFPDGHSCSLGSDCESGYCDNDGLGLTDDGWCFTPYSTYFDGQENSYCEYSSNEGIADCDERQVGNDLDKCLGASYYEVECSSSCIYQNVTSVFECNETGCSCSQILCDGLTTGSNITTCSSGQSYFADNCTSTASGQDRAGNICRSSNFASGCTADSQCNGIVAGTTAISGSCSTTCSYDAFPNVSLISPSNNNISSTGNITFNCSMTDDFKLYNVTLYHNISGVWSANQTKNLSGTGDSKTFIINDLPDNKAFIWNCIAYDNASQVDWADTNYTVTVDIPIPNITISSLSEINSSGTFKIFEFVILNNGETELANISWKADMGDGAVINSSMNSSLTQGEELFTYLTYNYSSPGNRIVTVNVTTINANASLSTASIYDLFIQNLSVIYEDGLNRFFEFIILNNGNTSLNNINWSLDTGENSIFATNLINLSINESVRVYVANMYSNYGTYTVVSTVTLDTFSISETLPITVKTFEVTNLSVLNSSGTKRTFEFLITNLVSSSLTNISWSFNTGNGVIINSTYNISLFSNERMFVYIDYNFTSTNNFTVNASAGNGTFSDWQNLTVAIT